MKNATGTTRRTLLCAALGFGLAPAWAGAAEHKVRALHQQALKVARPTQAVLQAVTSVGGLRLVAAGERGLVIFSDDAGQSWNQASVPVSVTLTALCFADDRRGWAVGNMGVVLATEDGGASWRKCLDGLAAAHLAFMEAKAAGSTELLDAARQLVEEGGDKPLLGVRYSADGTLYVVGAYGLAFSSKDGGKHWTSLMHRWPNPDGLSYYGMVERRGQTLLYGEQGLLLGAPGSAAEFAALESPSNGSLFGAQVLGDGAVLLLGLRGKLLRSEAPGSAWRMVQTPVDAALMAGAQLGDGRAVLVGAAGQLLLSEDGGNRFQPVTLRQRFPFTGVTQAPDGALLLTGMRGLVRLAPSELVSTEQPFSTSSMVRSLAA